LYGESTLLSQILDYGRGWFEGACPAEYDITLCNGAIDTIERMMAAHLVPGDKVVVEDPCYLSSANAIRQAGMQVVGAAVDECGMRPEALQRALGKGAKAVLVTPRAHNPTGASITAERAAQLKMILQGYPSVMLMEDDHFSLLAITEHHSVIPESTYNWAIFRSVSKGLGPDLRMAFVAADKESVKRINTRLAPGMSWVSRVLQSLVYTCLTKKTFKEHLQKAKENCALRRNILLKALAENGIEALQCQDGLNVWVYTQGDPKAVTYAMAHRGWLVRPGSSFDIQQDSQALRVSVQSIEPDIAHRFALELAQVIASKA
jgi:DNA-binding transcriptional MocR family regulator